MELLRLKKLLPLFLHLLFWILVWLFFSYFFGYNSDDRVYVRWFSSLLLPLTMAVTYLMVYQLIPRYLISKQYWRFALYSFYLLIFTSYFITLTLYGCLIFLLDFNPGNMPPMSKNYLFVLILVVMVVGVVSSITILIHNARMISRNKELQNKILATQLELKEQELNFLKQQIHPHFLFNTLNTIYGLSLEQSVQAPDVILKLSNLLDYILYQVSKPKVKLSEELHHIEEYVELERIRFKDTLIVNFETDKVDNNIMIAPMLLIPFVENSFKHGDLEDGFLTINIKISVDGERLNFEIENTCLDYKGDRKGDGIGLENIEKRLELNYRDNYHLEKRVDGGKFLVFLSIFDLNIMKNG